jgi:hypothetical protein
MTFFFFSLSPFTLLGLSGTFYGRLVFVIFPVVRRGSGYPRPPSLFSFFWTTQHEYNNTQHPWEAHPLLTSRWCPKSVALPSTTLPSAPDRHTHIHGPAEVPSFEKILPLRWDSNPLAPGPRPRSTVSDSHAATELPNDILFFRT